jgi:hypothetical protein
MSITTLGNSMRGDLMKTHRVFGVLSKTVALAALASLAAHPNTSSGAVIYESAALGPTGVTQGSVAATNINQFVFTGVRFELTQPVITSQVGGHFVSQSGGTFFGAVVKLDSADDFPDTGDLSSPDVLGTTTLNFPVASADVYGDLSLSLSPGWYALVFGSGLFGTSGLGVAPRNNMDFGEPDYVGFQPGIEWFDLSDLSDALLFVDHRFVVLGAVIPEPLAGPSMLLGLACLVSMRLRTR